MAGKTREVSKRNNHRELLELEGEVRAADLDQRSFSLRLDDGRMLVAQFAPEQEEAITEALRERATRRLRFRGRGEMASNRKIKRITSVESVSVEAELSGTAKRTLAAKPLWEVALEIGASVSDQEWAKVPKDGARKLHHYLYGAPRE
jgi:hypothetical protein